MTAIIIFSVIVLLCAAAVIHLARDARADMDSDSEVDVFGRRAEALQARADAVQAAVQRIRGNTGRDMPTVPAISRR